MQLHGLVYDLLTYFELLHKIFLYINVHVTMLEKLLSFFLQITLPGTKIIVFIREN